MELFFIRNNNWPRLLANPMLRNPTSGECSNLLYVVAARYLYVVHVLRLLSDDFEFNPCKQKGQLKIMHETPYHGVCYIPPAAMTCTSEYEVKLLGGRSGTLTGLFNQFFREPLGKDRLVPGFGKTPEKIFGVNVIAFKLEYALPNIFPRRIWPDWFKNEIKNMNKDIKYQILEIVVAIYKMRKSNEMYFNDLISDQVELRAKPNWAKIFHGWTVQLNLFNKKIKGFMESPHYSKDLSFRRRHNIAYELVLGTIESSGIPWSTMLGEDAMALMYGAEVYMTRGATRHVVGEMKMCQDQSKRNAQKNNLDDYWLSMLENWADANKEYNGECIKHKLKIQVCLLKMSKFLRRMTEAMHQARENLKQKNLAKDLLNVDDGLRKIVVYWEEGLRDKGIGEIPMTFISKDRPPTEVGRSFLSSKRGRALYTSRRRRTLYASRRRRTLYTSRRRRTLYTSRRRRTSYTTRRRRTLHTTRRRRTLNTTRRRRTLYTTRRRRTLYTTRRRRTLYTTRRRRTLYTTRRRRTLYTTRRRRSFQTRRPTVYPAVVKPSVPKIPYSIVKFLSIFKCKTSLVRQMGLSAKCMDAVHNEIRKYNRKLLLYKVRYTPIQNAGYYYYTK